ncbi:MAG: hypothetical protein ABIU09_01090 [Pyrinomonadaceae bacterium]
MTKSVNLVLILFVLGLFCIPETAAQTTEITYQGSLNVSSLPANANYDFEFRLYDALSGGTQVGPLVSQSTIAVADGVFSVRLDFGQNFPGADRYLEISVRPAGSGGFTLLNPRQKITSAPYAIRSGSAANATNAVTAINAQNLGGFIATEYAKTNDPRLTDSRNPLAGSASYIQNTNSTQTASNFNISGTGNANTFNATTRYNFAGVHLISALGLNNVFVGAGSGLLNTGNYNAFVGGLSGFENKGGSNNSFFGAEAGKNNSFGNNNSFFGAYSGNSTTTGSDNSFFGHRSGLANTAGTFNSFFGTYAGTFNSTGSDNSFFGNSTGFNSNGDRNSFFGSQAGNFNTSGSDNSFLGSFAGQANTTGSNNAFVGASSGSLNATGVNNSFFGTNSGFSNTASNNSFYGFDSGRFNTSGGNNSFFGRAAGRGNTSGELNVFVGVNAGNNNTLGSNNTIVGSEANVFASNLSYATAIGAEAVVSTSNTLVLGRPVDTVRVPGSMNVLGTFTAANLSISASNITGVIGTANGGTGLALAGTAGNFLRSNGTIWTSAAFTVADIPGGSPSYIQNTAIQQGTSNFNISGNGTAGGTLSSNVVNSVTQFNIGGARILSNAGIGNLFAGSVAGTANTTGASNSFFGSSAGSGNSSGSGNSFFGSSAGSSTSSGPNNTFIGASSGSGNSTGANNSYFGASAGQMNTLGSNNTLVGSNSNVGANNLTYATAIGADAVVSTNNTVVLGRTSDTVRVPGNFNVIGTLTAGAFSIPATSLTGVVPTANGGTGLGASGGDGSYLRSNGSSWTSSAIASGDLPAGNGNYIQNGVGLQNTSNFNISGTGTVGGLFSAATVNSTNQYNIGGTRVFAANGVNNVFVGSGTATTGDNNSFIGANTATANTSGTSNTIIGSGANVGLGNLIFATALGSGAVVNNNNSVVLGRAADTVRVPGNLIVSGTFNLPAANITGILAPLNGGTGLSVSTGTNFLRGNGSGGWVSGGLLAADIPTGSANYLQNGTTPQTSSFSIVGNGVISGNLSVSGTLTGGFTIPAGNISGVLGADKGGTGFSASTGTNFLRGNGSGGWSNAALVAADIPSLAANYIQNNGGLQAGANFNIGGSGAIAGNLTVGGSILGSFTIPVANIAGVLPADKGGTGFGASTGTNFLRGNGTGGWSNVALAAADLPSGSTSYIQNGTGAQASSNFHITNNGVIDQNITVGGNLSLGGALTGSFTVMASNITGVLAPLRGGTGLTASTGTNFLRGDGSGGWANLALVAADLPSGSGNYVQNGTTPQAGVNFSVGGDGTVGGTASAAIVNATTQYNIGGTRVFTTSGTNNIFAGAGTAITGSNNSFFGNNAGAANTSGTSNTVIGASANLATGGLINSTAIGASASVAQSNSLVLGSINGVNGATANTSVGIGTTTPKTPLDVRNGNIYVGSPGQGIILKSPTTNICRLLSIDDLGAMVFVPTTCP